MADLTLLWRQQVEVAKAIMNKPRLLILDEATSALSASVVESVFDLVREEHDKGTSVLLISHHFHEIEALEDRISVFRNRQRVATFRKGAHDYSEIIDMMVIRTKGCCAGLYPRGPQDRRAHSGSEYSGKPRTGRAWPACSGCDRPRSLCCIALSACSETRQA